MRSVLKWMGWALLGVVVAVALVIALGPREPRVLDVRFDEGALGADLDAYLEEAEAAFDDIVEGTQKRIVWAGAPGETTDWSVVYVHGFSASSEEVRPLPDRVADGLEANLYFARLAGHGRDGAAMAEPELGDWMRDMAEAMAIGRRLGERVLVIATSTGGTLATLAAADPDISEGLEGLALISPNFRVKNPAARILTWPAVEWWGPLIAGRTRGFEPVNEAQARYWTERYPTVAVLPMAASVAEARRLDHGGLTVPALFLFSDDDRVVDATETRTVASNWGGPAEVHPVETGPEDDPFAHVIAGDILSPRLTDPVATRILDWAKSL